MEDELDKRIDELPAEMKSYIFGWYKRLRMDVWSLKHEETMTFYGVSTHDGWMRRGRRQGQWVNTYCDNNFEVHQKSTIEYKHGKKHGVEETKIYAPVDRMKKIQWQNGKRHGKSVELYGNKKYITHFIDGRCVKVTYA